MSWFRSIWQYAIILGILACAGQLITIGLSESAEATIEGQSTIGGLTDIVGGLGFEGFAEMDISQSTELANQGVSPGDIETAVITNFQLDVVSPEDSDLSFISSLEVWIDAPDLTPVLVASQSNFPEGDQTVYFELEDVNLAEYAVSDSMNITTEASGTVPSENITISATVDFDIGVTAQGACNALDQ
jgi:hypothetical protein